MTARAPDLGDMAYGAVADANDWTSSGPRLVRPRRTAAGTVVGLFADAPAVATIQTRSGETLCVRVETVIPRRTPGR